MVAEVTATTEATSAPGREAGFLPVVPPGEEAANRRIFEGACLYVGLFHSRPW